MVNNQVHSAEQLSTCYWTVWMLNRKRELSLVK